MGGYYRGFLLDCCVKDKKSLDQFKIIKTKKAFWGLVKILEIEVEDTKLDQTIRFFQENMVDHIGIMKQYFFVHFYHEDEGIVVFKNRTFNITSRETTWREAIAYGVSLGIKRKQLKFEQHI